MQEDIYKRSDNPDLVLANIEHLQTDGFFDEVFICLKYHPCTHCSFVENHPGAQKGEVRYILQLGDTQRLRNEECVAGTSGATPLRLAIDNHIIFTGTDPQRDTYSAFRDYGSETLTAMKTILHRSGAVDDLYICGAGDATRYTAIDACVHVQDARIYIVQDACFREATLNDTGDEEVHMQNSQNKIHYVQTTDIVATIESSLYNRIPGNIIDETVLLLAQSEHWVLTEDRLNKIVDINARSSYCQRTILHACCLSGNIQALETLLRMCPDIDPRVQDDQRLTPLGLALYFAPRTYRTECVRLLMLSSERLRASVAMHQHPPNSQTSLIVACEQGEPEIVEILLQINSASNHIEAIDMYRRTALMLALSQESEGHARCAKLLFEYSLSPVGLLQAVDQDGWNALHYAARSGAFAHLSWSKLLGQPFFEAPLPINELTLAHYSFTHLATANGNVEVIRTLVELWQDAEANAERVEDVFQINRAIHPPLAEASREQGITELDLAIEKDNLEAVRMLLRMGCYASAERGRMQELLHRLVLMGDVEGCESILSFAPENDIRIDHALVALTKRIESPETCTSSCADFKHMLQFMYYCSKCEMDVCLVCRERCHKNCEGPLVAKGFSLSLCECSTKPHWVCQAIKPFDAREHAAQTFVPQPLDTSVVRLSPTTKALARRLARNMHNVWCMQKIKDSWSYSKTRDDNAKLHPLLVPFEDLTAEEAKYNMHMASETVKLILLLGFRLEPPSKDTQEPLRKSPPTGRDHRKSLRHADKEWDEDKPGCASIDTSKVSSTLSIHLEELIRCISVNSHEVWAREKITQGWRYAPHRNIAKNLKLNASLVPYSKLNKTEKFDLVQGVEETIKAIMCLGWEICPVSENATANILKRTQERARRESVDMTCEKLTFHNVHQMRQQLLNSYLLAAVRRGHLDSINIILSHSVQNASADLNVKNKNGRTALSLAVLGRHYSTVRHLLALHVDANRRDTNGFTAVSLAAYIGDLEMCKILVESEVDVKVLIPDNLGFTALHHAAYQGHTKCCEYLVRHLQQLYQVDEIVNLSLRGVETLQLSEMAKVDKSLEIEELMSLEDPQMNKSVSFSVSQTKGDSPIPQSAKARTRWSVLRLVVPKLVSTAVAPLGVSHSNVKETKQHISMYSPLSMAVQNEKIEVVKSLIELSADPIMEEPGTDAGPLTPYYRALYQHIHIADDVERLRAEVQERSMHWGFPSAPFQYGPRASLLKDSKRGGILQHARSELTPESIANKPLRELQHILKELELQLVASTELIDVLNLSHSVRRWRNRHAMWQFFRRTTVLIGILVWFAMMVQLAPDYDVTAERSWRESLKAEIEDNVQDVKSFEDMENWLVNEFPNQFRFNITDDSLIYMGYNRVIGGLKLEQTVLPLLAHGLVWQDASESLRETGESFVSILAQSTSEQISTVMNSTIRHNDTGGMQVLSIEMNLYNPLHNIYGIVQATMSTSFYAGPSLDVSVQEFRVDYRRFPPSREFEGTVAGMILLLLSYAMHSKIIRSRKPPAVVFVVLALLLTVLVIDYQAFAQTRGIRTNVSGSEFSSWGEHHRLLQTERRTVAVIFLLSMIPLLRAARSIPDIGPVIVALTNTITNLAVGIYLLVVAAACFLLAFCFHVGFGSSVSPWMTFGSTFYSLFYTPFVESWDGLELIASTSWSGLLAAASFIMFATININLLIAIVTDVYPKEREASDSMWEQFITEEIESSLRTNRKHKHLFRDLDINYWDSRKIIANMSNEAIYEKREEEAFEVIEPSSHNTSLPAQHPPAMANAALLNYSEAMDKQSIRFQELENKLRAVLSRMDTTDSITRSPIAMSELALRRPSAFQDQVHDNVEDAKKTSSATLVSNREINNHKLADNQNSACLTTASPPLPRESKQLKSSSSAFSSQAESTGTATGAAKTDIEPIKQDDAARIRTFLQQALAHGPSRLSYIKHTVQDHGWSWDKAKAIRREMGIFQHRETLEDGQVVRIWCYEHQKSPKSP